MKWCVLFFVLNGSLLFSLPQQGTVVAGDAQMLQENKQLEITTSDRAIIDWRSFSIDVGETTRFRQPSASSAVLNRVTGSDTSQLMGQLQANGKVYLINPHGLIIGKDAVIDTAAFFGASPPGTN